MEILMIFVAGIIISVSVYLVLSKSLIRIIIGTTLLSHGVHLMLLTMGGLKKVPYLLKKKVLRTMLTHYHKH